MNESKIARAKQLKFDDCCVCVVSVAWLRCGARCERLGQSKRGVHVRVGGLNSLRFVRARDCVVRSRRHLYLTRANAGSATNFTCGVKTNMIGHIFGLNVAWLRRIGTPTFDVEIYVDGTIRQRFTGFDVSLCRTHARTHTHTHTRARTHVFPIIVSDCVGGARDRTRMLCVFFVLFFFFCFVVAERA